MITHPTIKRPSEIARPLRYDYYDSNNTAQLISLHYKGDFPQQIFHTYGASLI